MQHVLKITADGKSSIVTADGQELGHGDVTQRVLHVLPKLFVDPYALSILKKESFVVEITSNIGVDLSPASGIIVRQPYPNQRYFVGGSADIRNGWIVPIPDGIYEFEIEISWHIDDVWELANTDDWEIRHKIHVVLVPGTGNTYSMDANCWPRIPGVDRQPKGTPSSRLGVGYLKYPKEEYSGREILDQSALVFEHEEGNQLAGYYLEEKITIPGIKMDQAWSIDAFQDEQLHEITQGTQFATGNDQHRLNASIEMPAGLLVEAVKLARSVKFEKGSDFEKSVVGKKGGCEQHPALKLLADWWTEHRPIKTPHKVGFAMPWIRVRDDGEYFCAHYEVPNAPIETFASDVNAQARIGDVVLVLFFASHEHFTSDDQGIHVVLADGSPFSVIGMDPEDLESGEFDEAWYSLKALASFPSRFPEAWKMLKRRP